MTTEEPNKLKLQAIEFQEAFLEFLRDYPNVWLYADQDYQIRFKIIDNEHDLAGSFDVFGQL